MKISDFRDHRVSALVMSDYDATFGDGSFVEDFGVPPGPDIRRGNTTWPEIRLWNEFFQTALDAVWAGRRATA